MLSVLHLTVVLSVLLLTIVLSVLFMLSIVLYVLLLFIVLSVLLRLTDSDYPFDIFKLLLLWRGFYIMLFDHRSLTLSPFVVCGHIWKGISNRLSPISSFICTRHTSYNGFQRKTMYWTLREWSMSNPRKFPHFIVIRHPKWQSRGKAISSWMKLKKIK